jgi:hypothetical protein
MRVFFGQSINLVSISGQESDRLFGIYSSVLDSVLMDNKGCDLFFERLDFIFGGLKFT